MACLGEGVGRSVTVHLDPWIESVHLALGQVVLLDNLFLFVLVHGRHVRLGQVFIAALVKGPDPHLVDFFQNLITFLETKLLEELVAIERRVCALAHDVTAHYRR